MAPANLVQWPSALLLALPLSTAETASMIRVCLRFKNLFTERLYSSIVMNPLESHPYWEYGQLDEFEKKFSILKNTLMSSPSLLSHVRGLKNFSHRLLGDPASNAVDVRQDLVRLLAPQLTRLALSDLEPYPRTVSISYIPFPCLKEFTLGLEETYPLWPNSDSQNVEIRVAINLAERTSLRSLRLVRLQGSYSMYSTLHPMGDVCYRATKGKELMVTGASLSRRLLEDLARAMAPLETLIYVRETDFHANFDGAGSERSDEVPKNCEVTQNTVPKS